MRYSLGVLLLLEIVAGCGKAQQTGNPDAYQSGSSNCSRKFVDDYNALGNEVHSLAADSDLSRLRQSIESFKTAYAGVKCDASQNGEKKTIDASKEADGLLTLIDNPAH